MNSPYQIVYFSTRNMYLSSEHNSGGIRNLGQLHYNLHMFQEIYRVPDTFLPPISALYGRNIVVPCLGLKSIEKYIEGYYR